MFCGSGSGKKVMGVIISSTRELSSQIYHVARPFIATIPSVRAVLLVGGTYVREDRKSIEEGVNLLIGTPGKLYNIKILILDEADRLLDTCFRKQITSVISQLPKLVELVCFQLHRQKRAILQEYHRAFTMSSPGRNCWNILLHLPVACCYAQMLRQGDLTSQALIGLFSMPPRPHSKKEKKRKSRYLYTQRWSDCTDGEASYLSPKIRNAAKEDRHVMEKGLNAFVSYVRAYKEHRCSYIFRWKELKIGKLGIGYGLLQLPLMPEIKHHSLSVDGFTPVDNIDLTQIKYKDKHREKQRQKNLQAKKAAAAERNANPEKPKPKQKGDTVIMKKQTCKQRKAAQSKEDDDELEREYRLLKKLKHGFIDEAEFDRLTHIQNGSDEDEDPPRCAARGSVLRSCSGKRKKTRGEAERHRLVGLGRS